MNDKWIKPRHRVVKFLLTPIWKKALQKKYHLDYSNEIHLDRPYLIMSNHQTFDDQFFLSCYFSGDMYIVASDDVLSTPIVSDFIKWAVNPIPYHKSSVDLGFFKKCLRVKNEGGSILIFPEGNKTYSGETGYINPTISKMIKFLKMPILFVNIRGGFTAYPRFADKARDAKIDITISKPIEYDEYNKLSNEELFDLVKSNLYVNEVLDKRVVKSNILAEHIERVLYLCPKCGMTHFISSGNTFKCIKCNETFTYNSDKTISGNTKHKDILSWYKYQEQVLFNTNLLNLPLNEVITSDKTSIYEIKGFKKKRISNNSIINLYPNRLEITYKDEIMVINFDDIVSAGCFNTNRLNVLLSNTTYQFKDNHLFNPVKYMQYIYKYKIEKGSEENDFLGI